jgi:hypothetical protein
LNSKKAKDLAVRVRDWNLKDQYQELAKVLGEDSIVSVPPAGCLKVKNIYIKGGKLQIEFDDSILSI